ncbi:MAG: GNAT family N-acetyltransferase [Candidatus Cloacimonetes bacterium]|nr:GNAT family N-acetyltransferase [Candidatus Cloacimonadota bacterium]
MKRIIKGKRVILRPLCDDDASFFAHWYNHPEVMFQCGFHEPTTLKIELDNIQKPETSERDWYAVTTVFKKFIHFFKHITHFFSVHFNFSIFLINILY